MQIFNIIKPTNLQTHKSRKQNHKHTQMYVKSVDDVPVK